MKVYCYHSPIPNSGAEPIIALWRESWEKHGWTPVVLGEQDVIGPFFEALKFKTRMLPTINDHRYEFASYVRWLAMARQSGGFLCDYDVVNVGFRPQDLPSHSGRLMRLNRRAPCAVFGTTWNYLSVVDMFLSYTPQPDDLFGERMHVSDQTILNRYPHTQQFEDLCGDARQDNKEKLVHFSTIPHFKDPGSKEKAIREFLKS